jgi:hypothetical protein
MAREILNSSEPPRSAMARRREHEPTPPPAGATKSRPIQNERTRLEFDVPLRLI